MIERKRKKRRSFMMVIFILLEVCFENIHKKELQNFYFLQVYKSSIVIGSRDHVTRPEPKGSF